MRQAGQEAAKKANNSKAQAKAKALEDPEATDSAKLNGDDDFTSTKILPRNLTAETDSFMNPESASPMVYKEGDIPEEGDVRNEISEEGLDTPTTTEGLHTLSSTRTTESEFKQFGQKEHAVKFKISHRAGPELKNLNNRSSDASASIDEPYGQAAKENEQPHQHPDLYTNESNPEPNTSGHGTDNTQNENNAGEIELTKDDRKTPLEPTMSTEDEHTIEPKSSEAGDNNMEHDNDKEAGTQNQIPENPSLKSTAVETKPSEVNKDPVLAAIERGKTGGPLLDHRQLRPNVLTKNDEMAEKPPGQTTQDQPAASAPEAEESVGD